MFYCSECGAEVDGKAKFCPNCGGRIFSKSKGLERASGTSRSEEAPAEKRTHRGAEKSVEAFTDRPAKEGPQRRKGGAKIGRILIGVMVLVIAAVLFYAIPASEGIESTTAPATTQITSTTTSSTTPPAVLGVLEGATNYVGAYPAATDVSYIDAAGVPMAVLAYPGQVQVFFDPATSATEAEEIVEANGGEIIGAIPLAGYYLVQVGIGIEATFISSLRGYRQVINALPNLALEQEQDGVYISEDYLTTSKPLPLNVHGPVAIDSGRHGRDVVGTAAANGGEITDIVNITGLDGRTPGDKWVLALNAVAQGNAIFNPGKTTFINISQGAGYRDDARSGDTNRNGELGDWSDWSNLPPELQQEAINNRIAFMSNVLRGIQSLPYDLYNDTFITMSGGNNNMPLEPVLNALRSNSGWEALLRNTVLDVDSDLQGLS
ncbi:MAG: zinc-ribbon domain-containing protein, partial [Candidatus Hadarchaeum sp.]|uniref:zinc-ribbon domain-containing protein n=1 Tax=Candidatus Hadarchaeum sp. TaxID=2883567 RepID=UPI003D12889B